MEPHDPPSVAPRQILHLARGGQAVINGALVVARESCALEIGSGAHVLSGIALWQDRDPLRNPHEELYFSMMETAALPARFGEARFRLFDLLAQVVAQDRSFEAQQECARCAAALMGGNAEEATQSAARLVAGRLNGYGQKASPRAKRLPANRPTAHSDPSPQFIR